MGNLMSARWCSGSDGTKRPAMFHSVRSCMVASKANFSETHLFFNGRHLDIRASSDDTPVMIPGSWSSRKKEGWKGREIARENGLMETKSEKMRNSTWMRKSNVGDMSDRGEADMRNG